MATVHTIRRRNQEQASRYRCTTCEGRRQVWDHKIGKFVHCPHCCQPDDLRSAA